MSMAQNRGPELPTIAKIFGGIAAIVVSLGIGDVALQPWIKRNEAVTMWNKHMLDDTGAYYGGVDLQPIASQPTPVLWWFGKGPISPDLATKGIVIQDFARLHGSGWIIAGGPVSEISLGNYNVELYAREVLRSHYGFFDNHIDLQEAVYDFFLVRHDNTNHALILKQWTNLKGDGTDVRPAASVRTQGSQVLIEIRNTKPTVSERMDIAFSS
jgi:hypothetical protein